MGATPLWHFTSWKLFKTTQPGSLITWIFLRNLFFNPSPCCQQSLSLLQLSSRPLFSWSNLFNYTSFQTQREHLKHGLDTAIEIECSKGDLKKENENISQIYFYIYLNFKRFKNALYYHEPISHFELSKYPNIMPLFHKTQKAEIFRMIYNSKKKIGRKRYSFSKKIFN